MKLPRHAEIWLQPYVADRVRRFLTNEPRPVRRIWFAIADHYEPFWNHADLATARRRVDAWRNRWPEIAARAPRDSAGSAPNYTFFYPQEEYHPDLLELLAEMTHAGIADVEVHIHHDGDSREEFIHKISTFCQTLRERHGLLRTVSGRTTFGFIHGNWALDNSLPGGLCCGLNNEIAILRDLGCYADFTMPSGNSPSQARTINTLYWCTGDSLAPKSYDYGTPVRRGEGKRGDLLMIPGPLGLRWKERLLPRMESGELTGYDLPSPYRVQRWFDLAPRIGEDVFVKLHSHGAADFNLIALLNVGLPSVFQLAVQEAQRRGISIYFVSTWQMYCAVEAISKALEPEPTVFGSSFGKVQTV